MRENEQKQAGTRTKREIPEKKNAENSGTNNKRKGKSLNNNVSTMQKE